MVLGIFTSLPGILLPSLETYLFRSFAHLLVGSFVLFFFFFIVLKEFLKHILDT